MEHCMDKNITDWSKIKTEIKDALGDFVWKETDDYSNYYGSLMWVDEHERSRR